MHSALLSLAVITGLISAGTDFPLGRQGPYAIPGLGQRSAADGILAEVTLRRRAERGRGRAGRLVPGAACQTQEKDGWLNLSTGKLTVSYKLGSGPFSARTICGSPGTTTPATISGNRATKTRKNLGGIPGQLGMRSTVRVTDPGPLSRNGYYWLDDSRTALFDTATDWVKPRPGERQPGLVFPGLRKRFRRRPGHVGQADRTRSHVAPLCLRRVVRLAGLLLRPSSGS